MMRGSVDRSQWDLFSWKTFGFYSGISFNKFPEKFFEIFLGSYRKNSYLCTVKTKVGKT